MSNLKHIMESSKLVHIAAEVILMGGISMYFNGQIKSLRNEIKELKTKYDEHTEATNKHLNNVYALIDKFSHADNMVGRPTQSHAPPVSEGLRHRRKTETKSYTPSPLPSRPSTPILNPSPEDLDEELGKELQELEEEDALLEDELKDMELESNLGSKKK